MVQLTERDSAMLDSLTTVRLADLEAIRWALAGLAGEENPTTLRRVQQWVARLHGVGLLGRAKPAYQAGSVVWPTHMPIGHAPNLYRQTTRHELAVAAASARFLTRGYQWRRDRKPAGLQDHQADGVAYTADEVVLVEVELTPKTLGRYQLIHRSHAERLSTEVSRVVYLCTPDAARTVSREADRLIFRDLRPRLVTAATFDVHGRWTGPSDSAWLASGPTVPVPGRTPELWEQVLA
jgi:hypothetical protein